ncbi:MAG: serine/threonine protein kinase, partial [Desulfobacterales bacterium]|nr:serine/threonine protein kinase [Desulfobacterales bacterium]
MKYGRYKIVRELGKGSMGVVYEAHDPNIDRSIALKVLRPDRVTSKAFVERFLKEAKAVGRFSHPNIVTVYDVGQDHGTIYIAMEFLEGKPLDSAIREKSFTIDEIMNIGAQVAETLDCAHEKGIIHRDIKPSNILLMSNGQIKITDFGIAHIEDPSAAQLTQAGEILGTPAYMSPEQVVGRPVDGRSDLYSLGVILYELSTGKRPFRGSNLAAVFNAVTRDSPPEPAKIKSGIPLDLSRVIMKSMGKAPDDRFQTGTAMVEALKSCVRQRKPPVPGEAPGRKQRRIPVISIVLVVFLISVMGVLSYYLMNGNGKAMLNVRSVPAGARVFVDG